MNGVILEWLQGLLQLWSCSGRRWVDEQRWDSHWGYQFLLHELYYSSIYIMGIMGGRGVWVVEFQPLPCLLWWIRVSYRWDQNYVSFVFYPYLCAYLINGPCKRGHVVRHKVSKSVCAGPAPTWIWSCKIGQIWTRLGSFSRPGFLSYIRFGSRLRQAFPLGRFHVLGAQFLSVEHNSLVKV